MDSQILAADVCDSDAAIPDEIAEAWAAVFIDLYEQTQQSEVEHAERRLGG